jgi:hypothetical protein
VGRFHSQLNKLKKEQCSVKFFFHFSKKKLPELAAGLAKKKITDHNIVCVTAVSFSDVNSNPVIMSKTAVIRYRSVTMKIHWKFRGSIPDNV